GYLAGGQQFGPFVSANITPDSHGLPAGLTWPQFKQVIRTGHDPEGGLLQVMPWPAYQDMTDRDLQAVYEYLRAIPSLPGQQ
ncbi:MAG TPA: cytochrome C, partial [Thermoanaerobaculia bacterium]